MDLKIIFTFFYVHERDSDKINNINLPSIQKFLQNKDLSHILYAQKGTENVLKKKNTF